MAWGIHLTVYGAAMSFSFLRIRRKQRSTYTSWAFMVYMTIILAMATTYVGTNIQDNERLACDPGGPLAYAEAAFDTPMILIGNNVYPVIAIFLNDALLVWWLYIIWDLIWMVAFAVIMLMTSFVTGVLLLYTSAQPGHTFNSADAVSFGTAYFSISLSLTVIVTLVIVSWLVYLQNQATKALGNTPEYRDHYYILA
ncbi:hypothetical protein D9758_007986 [Tetrapyrgos nigripes]|uniref:Uncharacterized protein n=1 Tax=Tetrapyrgos nigripes TaxID=182062 RepID=A0A8H5FW35_9AGAR|nr:hypothetical protein D9758_007986 [Tetrapyrgos nigripes]